MLLIGYRLINKKVIDNGLLALGRGGDGSFCRTIQLTSIQVHPIGGFARTHLDRSRRSLKKLQLHIIMPQRIYKAHYDYQNFSSLANGVYLIAITKQIPLGNGNSPITDTITVMGVGPRSAGQYRF